MPQPLAAQLVARGTSFHFPQLPCGAMPFIGMAASVVVVVQVLVMDFSVVLVLDSLFQAGFCVVFLFLSHCFFSLRLSPLLPRNVFFSIKLS